MRDLYKPVKGTMLQAFCLEQRVKPMPRPRINGKRVYVPDVCSDLANDFSTKMYGAKITQPVIVDCHFHFKQASKLSLWPVSQKIGDLDNLNKTIFDSLVKSEVLDDDRLVVGSESTKIFSGSDHVWVFIYSVADTVEHSVFKK
jgi:Holliday junction resolvase RusA-like endonuclease